MLPLLLAALCGPLHGQGLQACFATSRQAAEQTGIATKIGEHERKLIIHARHSAQDLVGVKAFEYGSAAAYMISKRELIIAAPIPFGGHVRFAAALNSVQVQLAWRF